MKFIHDAFEFTTNVFVIQIIGDLASRRFDPFEHRHKAEARGKRLLSRASLRFGLAAHWRDERHVLCEMVNRLAQRLFTDLGAAAHWTSLRLLDHERSLRRW